MLEIPDFDILYQDDYFVAINKPSGLFVHRSNLDRNAPYVLGKLRNKLGRYVYPVHRLDRPTSGVLVFGLTSDAAGRLSALFREKTMMKHYIALVRGFTENDGTIDHPVKNETGGSKTAISQYRTLSRYEIPIPVGRYGSGRYSLVEIIPETGRRHQIRKHMAHIFHPIVGDTAHGDSCHNRFFRAEFDMHRLLLHALKLEFTHPYLQEDLVINAEPAPPMNRFLKLMKSTYLI